jgi:hypothetical protein
MYRAKCHYLVQTAEITLLFIDDSFSGLLKGFAGLPFFYVWKLLAKSRAIRQQSHCQTRLKNLESPGMQSQVFE